VFGINGSEFLVLLAVAAVVLGPERLPQYTQQLTRLIRELRRMAQGAQEKVREELGPDFDDVDWRKLDPRQYDPRRIVREALSDAVDLDDPLGLRDGPRDSWGGGSSTAYGAGRGGAGSSNGSRPAGRLAGSEPDGPDMLFDPDATGHLSA
jgi:sec-independent protein translocase protein TatB